MKPSQGLNKKFLKEFLKSNKLNKDQKDLNQQGSDEGSCASKSHCNLCLSKGFVVKIDGPFTTASICKCIANCLTCYGKAVRTKNGVATTCKDVSPHKVASIITSAKIPSRYAWADFNGFSNFAGNGRDVLATCRQWVKNFKGRSSNTPNKGLLLTGDVGVGKTYLLTSLALELAKKGVRVRFCDFFQLLSELKAAYSDGKTDLNLLSPLMQVDVLVVDELGKGRNFDWELTILDQLINGRYNSGKLVVASTNYKIGESVKDHSAFNFNLDENREPKNKSSFNPDKFGSLNARVGQRIYSRIIETCTPVELKGRNFRL